MWWVSLNPASCWRKVRSPNFATATASRIWKRFSCRSSAPTRARRPEPMNFKAIGVVYRKELTEWLLDRRTLISTVLVPLLAFPILMVGITALATILVGNAEKEVPRVMNIGGKDSPPLPDG